MTNAILFTHQNTTEGIGLVLQEVARTGVPIADVESVPNVVLSIRTIDDLRAVNTAGFASGTTRAISGYYIGGDADLPLYVYRLVSTADNNGSVIKPNGVSAAAQGRWVYDRSTVFASWFGVLGGDANSAQDRLRLQNALDSGAERVILDKNVVLDATLTIRNSVVLESAGCGQSIRTANTFPSAQMLSIKDVNCVRVRGITFDTQGELSTNTGNPVQAIRIAENAVDVEIDDCRFTSVGGNATSGGVGIELASTAGDSSGIRVKYCEFSNSIGDCINISGRFSDIEVSHCSADQWYRNFVQVQGSTTYAPSDLRFYHNNVGTPQSGGIKRPYYIASAASGPMVERVTILGGSIVGTNDVIYAVGNAGLNTCIYAFRARNGRIAEVDISGGGANGVYIAEDSRNWSVSDNSISYCKESGVYLNDCRNVSVVSNQIFNNENVNANEGGIEIRSSNSKTRDCQIRTNQIFNETNAGATQKNSVVHFSGVTTNVTIAQNQAYANTVSDTVVNV